MMRDTKTFATARLRSAFTLTEMLVAVALLVVIMLSVSTIFRTTSRTVSVGMALTEATRKLSTASSALHNDIMGAENSVFGGSGMMPVNGGAGNRPPYLMIVNNRQYAFQSRQSWIAEGSVLPAPTDTAHEYRTDMLGFFANGSFKRQTGGVRVAGVDIPESQSSQISNSAYIWYGHLWLPNNAGGFTAFTLPGAGNQTTNPNNFFASQWTLGRVALLMFEPAMYNVSPGVDYHNGVPDLLNRPVHYYYRDPTLTEPDAINLSPLSWVTTAALGTTPGYLAPPGPVAGTYDTSHLIYQSRYDAIGTHEGFSWDDYGGLLSTCRDPAAGPPYTYNTMTSLQYFSAVHFNYRFQGVPNADVYQGLTAQQFADILAQNVPLFLSACARFKVDFAGDFISQSPATGLVNVTYTPKLNGGFDATDYATPQTDGVIDFNIDPLTQERTIRWYGLPDDPAMPIPNPAAFAAPGDLGRSIPVAPVFYSRGNGVSAGTHQWIPFEETFPNHPISNVNWRTPDTYRCSWSRREMANATTLAPRLIRITIQILDADGRLEDGMTQQFIFPVKFN